MQVAALETLTNGRSYLWVIKKFQIGDIIYFAIKSGLIEIFKETFKEILEEIYTVGYNELRPFAHENLLKFAADQGNLLRGIDNTQLLAFFTLYTETCQVLLIFWSNFDQVLVEIFDHF